MVHPQGRKKKKGKNEETSLDIHFDILAPPEEITLVSYLSIYFSVLARESLFIIFHGHMGNLPVVLLKSLTS